ncbi:MAG: transcription antitermination factor NusB [Clostridiales bacterium]|nr:transcription antitermination factor NusB [Clostridiales bacterium]
MTRREAREQAFILIFEHSFREEGLDEIIADAVEARCLTPDEFAVAAAKGVDAHQDELDGVIEQYSRKWEKNRISRVALSLLRLAVYEMRFSDEVPVGVAINEAVELSKKYAGEEDASFINGILGGIARDAQAPSGEGTSV